MKLRSSKQSKKEDQMSTRDVLSALLSVLKIIFKISPSTVMVKLIKSIVDAVLPLLVAFLAASVITNITKAASGDEVAKSTAILFVVLTAFVTLLSSALNSVSSFIDEIMRFKVESKVTDMLFERFVNLDFWRYEDKETIEMYDKAQDFARFFAYMVDRVAGLFTALFGMVSALLALGLISWWLVAIFALAILPGMVIQYRLSRMNIEHWRLSVTDRRKQSFIEYNMIQPKVISELRLYNLASTFLDLRSFYRDRDQGRRLEYEKGYIKWRLLGDSLMAIVELSTLLWAVAQVVAKRFVYIQQVVSRAIGSADSLISQYGSADEDLAKLKDFNDFMNLPLGNGTHGHKIKEVKTVELQEVSFAYPGSDRLVLDNISMKIEKGEHVAFVGENGAGKSTLIKILLGFFTPTSGRVLINGLDLKEINLASWHKQVGVLLQDFTSFHFTTVGENIRFGDVSAKKTRQRIDRAMQYAEAEEFIKELPLGLDTPMAPWMEEEHAVDLSGGQWQRVGLARNFYRESPVMILDEPTSAIDALAEAKIFDRLFNKANKRTIIAISHRLTTIEQADVIYVLKNGSIIQSGAHKELSAQKDGQYVKMFRRQLKNA